MADGPAAGFREGRAALRETAKWLVSGLVGVSAFIIGSSAFSAVGDLAPGSGRFWIAAGGLSLSVALCWVVVGFAIRVLRSDLKSLKEFIEAPKGELKVAADAVAERLGESLWGTHTLRRFYADYGDLRVQTWTAAGAGTEAASKALQAIDETYQTCREACVSQMVMRRFDALTLCALGLGGPIFAGFLAFAWAANPRDEAGLLDKPYVEALTAAQAARLQQADVDAACLGPEARLLVVASEKDGGRRAVLLPSIPPAPAAGSAAAGSVCPTRVLTLAGASVLAVD